MKWSCITSRCGLCTRSFSLSSENGTLPITASNVPGRNLESANDSVSTLACGYSRRAIAAVVGSNSTPTIAAVAGARPRKLPDPQPGSNTGPLVTPRSVSVRHMMRAIAGSV